MAHHGQYMAGAAARSVQPAAHAAPAAGHAHGYHGHGHASNAPTGTFSSGTKIQVGSHRVVIQKYLSEGGFAHVYLVKLPKAENGTDVAVLKRVAVPDKEALRAMRTEVETMKRLKGHRPIVTYIDSHASEMQGGGGYEVFLLMEFCNGGGLIDFMNTRLQHRLTEPEILHIFTDIAEGVACMHYLKPPLLHRDLKVENVLILNDGSRKRFKLCDFGSAAPPRAAPQTVVDCRLVDEDVQKHTTMQYRSPEMVDVYRKQPIDEKSDIWALGVLLYKLCYYTTPFEEQGTLAILNASFKFHSHPVFSERLKRLIGSMLRENQQSRPNIYQVLRESCAMQGREVPIHDIYSTKSHSEPRGKDKPLPPEKPSSTPVVGAVYSPPPQETETIPEVTPMRRGRPVAASKNVQQKNKPNPSPGRVTSGDPFAALDTKPASKGSADELASRFPTLDQFSLLHDQGSKFDFDAPISPPVQSTQNETNPKTAQNLANEAFAKPEETATKPAHPSRPHSVAPTTGVSNTAPVSVKSTPLTGDLKKTASPSPRPSEMSRASTIISNNPELQAISSQSSKYVSTGTMTMSPPPAAPPKQPEVPIWRVPSSDRHRATSLSKETDQQLSSRPRPDDDQPAAVTARDFSSRSQTPLQSFHQRKTSSSRPSLEGSRPKVEQLPAGSVGATSSGRQRPASTHLDSSIDFLRERQMAAKSNVSPGLAPRYMDKTPSPSPSPSPGIGTKDETNIESNVEFLRSMEGSNDKKDRTTWHGKRSTVASTPSGTNNMFGGKFGHAFKRFEGQQHPPSDRTPSPRKEHERRELTPVAGSEATDGRSDDGRDADEDDGMTPEQRRDLERQRLLEEERRVEAAQAEYRQRRAAAQAPGGGRPAPPPKPAGGSSRAAKIQNRVQSLLDESQKPAVKRTAQGYGAYSDAAHTASRPVDKQLPDIPRKPVPGNSTSADKQEIVVNKLRHPNTDPLAAASKPAPGAKPAAPRKPMHLNNIATGSTASASAATPPKQTSQLPLSSDGGGASHTTQLIGLDMPGQPGLDMTPREKDDYLEDFSKRFPSLSSIEMVERDIDGDAGVRGGS